jgi:hypothetical protein
MNTVFSSRAGYHGITVSVNLSSDRLNPERANAHLRGYDDAFVDVRLILDRVGDWSRYLETQDIHELEESLRNHSKLGRPARNMNFVVRLENLINHRLERRKPWAKLRKLIKLPP